MIVSVAQFDRMADADATSALTACCGSSTWVATMMSRRPFRSRGACLAASDSAFETLQAPDWLEAFSHHPRIGERQAAASVSATAAAWSASEQSNAAPSGAEVNAELAAANAAYEARFGFIFIICARGRGTDEILAALRARMHNEADAEIAIAAREQQQITHLRLEALLRPTDHA